MLCRLVKAAIRGQREVISTVQPGRYAMDFIRPAFSAFDPLMLRDATRMLVLRDNDRDHAMAAFRRELLALVDGAIVLRLAASNKVARQTILSWDGQ